MKTSYKVFAVVAMAFMLTATFTGVVNAIEQGQTQPKATQEQIEAEKARLRKIKEGMVAEEKQESRVTAEKCALVQERVQSKLNGYAQTESKYGDRYEGIVMKLEDTSAKLSEAGYDTSELDGKIETLKGMVADFEADFATFIEGVRLLDEKACEEGEAAFLEALADVRKDLQKVRDTAAEIRVFIKGEVRQSLMDLKEQVVADRKESGEESKD